MLHLIRNHMTCLVLHIDLANERKPVLKNYCNKQELLPLDRDKNLCFLIISIAFTNIALSLSLLLLQSLKTGCITPLSSACDKYLPSNHFPSLPFCFIV